MENKSEKHPTITVQDPNGYDIEIDEQIADLITSLWR